MPKRPPRYRPCPGKPCARAEAGRRYDRGRRADDEALNRARRIRCSRAWRQRAKAHLDAHPVCADPFGTHGWHRVDGEQVHHVEPLTARPDLAFAAQNLRSLCTECHARVEHLERSGRKTQALFQDAFAGDLNIDSVGDPE